MVKPKKYLGQHFLVNDGIAQRTAEAVNANSHPILEIGPGKGKLTGFLLSIFSEDVTVVEIDKESVEYLNEHFPQLRDKIIDGDFLNLDLDKYFNDKVNIVGNFPYNISSQILFRMLEYRHKVPQLVGMFQKEVADRVVTNPGSKVYGILSVLIQAFYDTSYLFTIQPGSFFPPPKVKSAVIKLERNGREKLDCDEKLFFKVVKLAFNQRRKTLRNSIKTVLPENIAQNEIFNNRPEQLGHKDFEHICNLIERNS
ncbi:MAG: 16S rRNA (adenine(1518)-N(6)/adenine(1519)-N(6))-dimethyltransferase [Salinivirgaceae bacterium]|nr:MAG: 16S rRNA (adenine(1518)-N(6)/adenine(1519)-N(6))-dimethyltransferase [Salinivirgaceae bacterium]